jgi:hypothetical protein
MNPFKKAERHQVKLKLAVTGPSGSGKTYSALLIAKGLSPGGKIALIDTENGSGSLYADSPTMPGFDVLELGAPFTTKRYMESIQSAVKAGYDVLVIDSLTHQWAGEGGILDRIEKEKQARPGQNSFTVWAKYTPEHETFKQSILQAPIHIIATMRSKQDYIMEQNDKGKQTPRKVGLAPVQREGAEYEFTTVFDLSMTHYATTSKDRTGLFDGEAFLPSEETGTKLMEWMQKGKEVTPPAALFQKSPFLTNEHYAELKKLREAAKMTPEEVAEYCKTSLGIEMNQLNPEKYWHLVDMLKHAVETKEPAV